MNGQPTGKVILLCILLGLPTMMSGKMNQIRVGPNVQVSKAHRNHAIREVLLAADPDDPNHLLACAIIFGERENPNWTVVYLSTDGGKNWRTTLETKDLASSADPACALGRSGRAYHLALGRVNNRHSLGIYRSQDGGQTWTQGQYMPVQFAAVDRESVSVDTTQGRFADRIYITAKALARDLAPVPGTIRNGFGVWRSRDGGVTFEGPITREVSVNHWLIASGNNVLLSDGTLVSLLMDVKNFDITKRWKVQNTPGEASAVLESVTSTDGGDSVSDAVKVDDLFMPSGGPRFAESAPTLAADRGDSPFRDRLYATWSDERDGRLAVRFSYSADRGKTWSRSTVIDEQGVRLLGKKRGPDNFLATVAVNKRGVVLVTWYDRSDNPDLGWYVRARASLDGGETWLPSIRVSEKPNTFPPRKVFTQTWVEEHRHVVTIFQPSQFFAGDYAGLAADARGTFHALWVDNRTGLPQVWTAAIEVAGTAIQNGSSELAQFTDVSDDLELEVVSSDYDRASNTVTIGIRLKNLSAKIIHGPVKLHLMNVNSTTGSPSVVNADNKMADAGAEWDFSSSLTNNVLSKVHHLQLGNLSSGLKTLATCRMTKQMHG